MPNQNGLPEPDRPLFLTIRQASHEWGVSDRFVERLIADGTLEVHRFGRAVRIKRDTLDALAREATNKPVGGR